MTHDRDADTPHFATARLFGLYTEVFCDRVALSVTGQPLDVVSMLIKLATGLDEVDPKNYLEQADEILKRGPLKTAGVSHPEEFMRAHVLQLWHERGSEANAEIAELIEGPPVLDALDLLAQERVTRLTRRLTNFLLAPKWLQTDVVMAHPRLFFPGYEAAKSDVDSESLKTDIEGSDQALLEYYCYVMLDFATADRELEEAPLAHAIGVAEFLGLHKRFTDVAAKELRLRKKQIQHIWVDRQEIVSAAADSEARP